MEQIDFKFDYSEEKVLIDGINCPECNYEIEQELDLSDDDFWIDEDGLVDECCIYCPKCDHEIVLEVEGETWLEFHITKLTFIDKSNKKGSE